MKTIKRSSVTYDMSPTNRPIAEAAQGEAIKFLTEDAYSGVLRTVTDRYPASMQGRANPATGPVSIAGTRAGNVLAVRIVSIRPVGMGTMYTGPTRGPLGYKLAEDAVAKLPIRRGCVRVDGRDIPLKPMVGVIGVAPAESIDTTWPGEHGGNLDCNVITAGATVYLPVAVDGALLAIGNVHAVQADGEVAICAVETRGEVVIKASIYRRPMITPAVETRAALYLLASAETLDAAETAILDKTYRYLTEIRGMGTHEAVRFMSLACDLQVCQVVDPAKTMRMRLPKKYL